jgi:hypothetical protein
MVSFNPLLKTVSLVLLRESFAPKIEEMPHVPPGVAASVSKKNVSFSH